MFQLKNAENVDDPLLRELINVHGVFRNFRGGGGSKGGSYLCNLDVFGSAILDSEIFLRHKVRYMVTKSLSDKNRMMQ